MTALFDVTTKAFTSVGRHVTEV